MSLVKKKANIVFLVQCPEEGGAGAESKSKHTPGSYSCIRTWGVSRKNFLVEIEHFQNVQNTREIEKVSRATSDLTVLRLECTKRYEE